ncbi:hypothetical protein HYW74_00055 [Candidatus Pacearchaeota archaeon]|nr:hypothetical protein [Candidatus Pacearchaeota archaeon]
MSQTEVEYIGEISKEKFDILKELFKSKGKFKKQKQRLSFMYFREFIPKGLSEIKNETVDLRFRVTNKQPEIILKYGLFDASHARKEISIEFELEESEKYIDFLSCLGWKIGVIYAAETLVYEYNEIEFSLVEIKDYGYNFEAEILADEDKVKEAKNKIEKQLNKLELKPFDEKGLNIQCNTINNKKDLQFDFSKQSFSEIKGRFKEFFIFG